MEQSPWNRAYEFNWGDPYSYPQWGNYYYNPMDWGGGGGGIPGWEPGGWFDPSSWMWGLPGFSGGPQIGNRQPPAYEPDGGTPTFTVDANGNIVAPQNQIPASGRGGIGGAIGAIGAGLGTILVS